VAEGLFLDVWFSGNHFHHEDTKRHEEHEVIFYKIILRDLRGEIRVFVISP